MNEKCRTMEAGEKTKDENVCITLSSGCCRTQQPYLAYRDYTRDDGRTFVRLRVVDWLTRTKFTTGTRYRYSNPLFKSCYRLHLF